MTILAFLDILYEVFMTNNFGLLYDEKVNFLKDLKGNKAIKIKLKQKRNGTQKGRKRKNRAKQKQNKK